MCALRGVFEQTIVYSAAKGPPTNEEIARAREGNGKGKKGGVEVEGGDVVAAMVAVEMAGAVAEGVDEAVAEREEEAERWLEERGL